MSCTKSTSRPIYFFLFLALHLSTFTFFISGALLPLELPSQDENSDENDYGFFPLTPCSSTENLVKLQLERERPSPRLLVHKFIKKHTDSPLSITEGPRSRRSSTATSRDEEDLESMDRNTETSTLLVNPNPITNQIQSPRSPVTSIQTIACQACCLVAPIAACNYCGPSASLICCGICCLQSLIFNALGCIRKCSQQPE